jgi:hypothetical protein
LSDAGIAVDFSGLPTRCYVGLPCRGIIKLRRPADGSGRAAVDALLSDPATTALLIDTGIETRLPLLPPDDRYVFELTYQHMAGAVWSIAFITSKGRIQLPFHQMQVRPALHLVLPASIDFGEVSAGTPLLGACQSLDFSGSQAAEEHRWVIEGSNLGSCASQPVLAYRDAAGGIATVPLAARIDVEALDPVNRWLKLCLNVPRCSGDAAPVGAAIRVSPRTSEFGAQTATVQLRWRVQGKGLFGCHGYWLIPLLAVGGTSFLLGGLLLPTRFPEAAAIRVSGTEVGLRRASAVPLRECPGSTAGFYRSARLGLHGTGDVGGRIQNALVLLRARPGEAVVITGRGPLEIKDRRTGRFLPVSDLQSGHSPSAGDVYRVGDVLFSLENA